MSTYGVTFIGYIVVVVEANSEEEARDRALGQFDGYVDWETDVEELDESPL